MNAAGEAEPGLPLAGKYLTFRLGEEAYGLGIHRVQEIIGLQDISAVPASPPWFEGVTNLRGHIIPVLNLRRRLGMEPHQATDRSCIIIVQPQPKASGMGTGLLVDEVAEVVDVPRERVHAVPALGLREGGGFILGMAQTPMATIILLDSHAIVGEPAISGADAGSSVASAAPLPSEDEPSPADVAPRPAPSPAYAGPASHTSPPQVPSAHSPLAPPHPADDMVTELQQCASLLVRALRADRYDEALEVINQLVAARDRGVYEAVGNLTRGLHEAIKHVHENAAGPGKERVEKESDMSAASDRLGYVVTMTEQAAGNTLEKVESAVPLVDGLQARSRQLRNEWQRQAGADVTLRVDADLDERMRGFCAAVDGDARVLLQQLQDILLEQGYQDLTGQVLARVITLVKDLEADLVGLVNIAGQVERLTGMVETAVAEEELRRSGPREAGPQGPNIHGDRSEDAVTGQDEVDALLATLGF